MEEQQRIAYWEDQERLNEELIKKEKEMQEEKLKKKLSREKLRIYRNQNGIITEVFERSRDNVFRGVIVFKTNVPKNNDKYGVIVHLGPRYDTIKTGPIYDTRYEAAFEYDRIVRSILGVRCSEGLVNFAFNSSLRLAPFFHLGCYKQIQYSNCLIERSDVRALTDVSIEDRSSKIYCPVCTMCCASKYEFGQHFVTQHMEIERLKI